MASLPHLVQALGGQQFRESVGLDVRHLDEDALINRIRSGLPYSALESVASRFSLSPTDLLQILRIPPRTLARRKKTQLLAADESDRLVRLARLGVLAEEILGNAVRAARWLRESNAALRNNTPIRWLDTDLGAKEVEELLTRIAHGVHS